MLVISFCVLMYELSYFTSALNSFVRWWVSTHEALIRIIFCFCFGFTKRVLNFQGFCHGVCGFTNINCQSKATCDPKADFNSWSTENTIGLKATSSTCLSQCRLWEVHCLAALLMLSFYILTASTAFFIKYIYRPYPFFWIFIFYSFCPHLKGSITRLNRFFKKIFKF